MSESQVHATLEHLFRRQYGKIVAHLTRHFGPDRLDLAESVVQEALLRATQTWPLQGLPDNPEAWIMRTAKNAAIDQIRKQRDLMLDPEVYESLAEGADNPSGDPLFEDELHDDALKLLFICCHPGLPREARLALTLKTVCGFSVPEIARAFLSKDETIAQRIVRAKHKISVEGWRFAVPPADQLRERFDSVLEVLYLMFNEGYLATAGEALVRKDLCEEAIYRATILSHHQKITDPRLFALLALMHFQISRFQARTDAEGEMLLLEEQDRSLWDRRHIAAGLRFLENSASGEDLSDYHLQAGIASCHAMAQSFADTDWKAILAIYDLMPANSPIILLNRAVAVAMLDGPRTGIVEIEKIEPLLKNYYLMPATLAELWRRAGDPQKAKKYYAQALRLVGTEPERRLILKRIHSCAAELI